MSFSEADQFLQTLQRLQLIEPNAIAQAFGPDAVLPADEAGMRDALLEKGLLTQYQAQRVAAGEVNRLAIHKYRIIELLGTGGLSSVYKARHVDLGFMAAVKVLHSEIFVSEEGRQQFLLEIESMAKLDHPNIVEFCDVDQAGDTFFFAMKFVDGLDLGRKVRDEGPLNVTDACNFIAQAALGLQHAHERNIVHRDIKPVNLLLTFPPEPKEPASSPRPGAWLHSHTHAGDHSRGLVKIIDWGLANLRIPKRFSQNSGQQKVARNIVGTADYLPPEQALDSNSVDIRGEIYSLGCSLYYLLTGQPPFPGGSLMQKILHHQRSDPKPVTEFRDDVPADVCRILKRMMAKKPSDRFQTPASLALALRPHARPKPGQTATPPALRPNYHSTVAPADQTPMPTSSRVTSTPPLPEEENTAVLRLSAGSKSGLGEINSASA